MNFWDQNFSVQGYKYGTAPNAFLVQQAHRLVPASDVLAPGDGEGRNSVWLAQQGHRASAMDASAVGLQKAQALAWEGEVLLGEGPGHQGLAHVTRWLGQAPAGLERS